MLINVIKKEKNAVLLLIDSVIDLSIAMVFILCTFFHNNLYTLIVTHAVWLSYLPHCDSQVLPLDILFLSHCESDI